MKTFTTLILLSFLSLQLYGDSQLDKFKGDRARQDGFYSHAWTFYLSAYKQAKNEDKTILLRRLESVAINANKGNETHVIMASFLKSAKAQKIEVSLLANIYLSHCNLLLQLRQFKEAAQACTTVLSQVDKLPEKTLQQALDFAVYSLTRAQQPEKASALIEKHLKSFADIERAELKNARLKVLLGQNINALAILDKYKDSKESLPAFLRLWAYLKAGETKRSLEIFELQIKEYKTAPDPAFSGVLIKLAESLYKENIKAATLILDKAYELETNADQKAYLVLKKAELLIATKQNSEAIISLYFFEKAYPQSNKKFWVLAQLAQLYTEMNEPESLKKSEAYLTTVIDSKQKNQQLHYESLLNRGKARIQSHALQSATDDFSQAAKVAASHKMPINQVSSPIYMAGMAQYLLGQEKGNPDNHSQAADFFKKVIEFNADLTEKAFIMRSIALRRAKKWQEAIDNLEAMLTRFPKNNEAHYLLGLSLFDAGDIERGIKIMNNFIAKNPQDKRAPEAIIESLRAAVYNSDKRQSRDQSLKLIKSFEAKLKDSSTQQIFSQAAPVILHLKAILSWKQNKEQDAEHYWHLFLKDYPEHFLAMEVRLWLAFKKTRQNPIDLDRAIALYEDILKLHPESKLYGFALWQFSRALFKDHKYSQALSQIEAAIQVFRDQLDKPGSLRKLAAALFFEGEIRTARGDYEFAIKSFTEAHSLSSDLETKLCLTGRIGDCYFSMAKKVADDEEQKSEFSLLIHTAIESYSTIHKSPKTNPFIQEQALYKLAKCYETSGLNGERTAQNGDLAKALEHYRELFFGYQEKVKQNQPTNSYYFCRTGYDLARLQMMFSPPHIKSAINTYEILAKSGLPGTKEARLLAQQLRAVVENEK